jgi:S-adenosylmethionine:tRNA ribosyltransferase-isomerase
MLFKNRSRLNLEDFAYELPSELVAQNPVAERDQSRLLYYDRQRKNLVHYNFYDINSILKPGDVLIVNNTRVLPVRLIGKRAGGGVVELLLIRQESGCSNLWQAMAAPIKKLKPGDVICVEGKNAVHKILVENIIAAADGQRRLVVRLPGGNDKAGLFNFLQDVGLAPLPPYILRSSIDQAQADLERYQTIFAREDGAVAAPTAGLHFSSPLLALLKKNGVMVCEITLHVGPGTFKPITTNIEEHVLEPEWFAISRSVAETITTAKNYKRRVIAVGTTTCRALESATIGGELKATEGSYTSLFIKPGYQFKTIDGLVTNFHLSQSSLLLLVAALMSKEELHRAYKTAIEHKYRFYSYGDAMIIL